MPVTARLSRRFYETFGDGIANELVEWFNQVDLTYRGELRELNEINFARFDAKLEQRIAEVKAELRQEIAQLRVELHEGLAQLRAELHEGLAQLRGELHEGLAQLRAELRASLGELRGEFRGELGSGLAALRADLMKWMFIFWAGSTATMIGVAVALARFLRP